MPTAESLIEPAGCSNLHLTVSQKGTATGGLVLKWLQAKTARRREVWQVLTFSSIDSLPEILLQFKFFDDDDNKLPTIAVSNYRRHVRRLQKRGPVS
jgi:hypothetical protein